MHLLTGFVDIVRKSPDDPQKEIHIVQLSDNSFFGENSFITGDHMRNASVRSGTYCDLMRLEHEDLENLAEFYPDFEESIKFCVQEKELGLAAPPPKPVPASKKGKRKKKIKTID
jgi:CRP-like cAMP-binding protein